MYTAVLTCLFLTVAGFLAWNTARDIRLRVATLAKLVFVRDEKPRLFWLVNGTKLALAAAIVLLTIVTLVRAALDSQASGA